MRGRMRGERLVHACLLAVLHAMPLQLLVQQSPSITRTNEVAPCWRHPLLRSLLPSKTLMLVPWCHRKKKVAMGFGNF